MPAHQVFCSSCGGAQLMDSQPGFFFLKCDSCLAITVGLGANWVSTDEDAPPRIPLAPLLSFQEKEIACTTCEASLTIEMALRSHDSLCPSCSGLGKLLTFLAQPNLPPASLTFAERTFLLGQPAPAQG